MEKTKRKSRAFIWILAALVIIIIAAIFVFQRNYTFLNGEIVSRDKAYIDLNGTGQANVSELEGLNAPEVMDLRGTEVSAEEIAQLKSTYPDCRILWTVKVCEGLELDNEITALTLANGTQAEALPAFADELSLINEIKVDYPNISKSHYDALAAAFPAAEIEYSVVIAGEEVPLDTEKLDFSAFSYDEVMEAAELIKLLPMLTDIELMSAEGASPFSLDEVILIQEACPGIKLNYCFELFGMDVSTATERLEYYDTEIGDEGLDVFRKVIPIMHGLKYLRFDNCGTSDDGVAQLRDEFPEVKVVWLLTVGKAQFYTDTIRIRVNFNFLKEEVWKLKYCTDVKYIDCGHLLQIFDVEWARYMPNLEVCIVALTNVKDISPLAECKNLEFLEIFSNDIHDISALAECENLQYLNISNIPIDDITAIYGLDKLVKVNCNMVRDVPQEQVDEFRRLHPDTIFNFYRYAGPTETNWRIGGENGTYYNERYALLREQMGYDEYRIAPYGYLPAPID